MHLTYAGTSLSSQIRSYLLRSGSGDSPLRKAWLLHTRHLHVPYPTDRQSGLTRIMAVPHSHHCFSSDVPCRSVSQIQRSVRRDTLSCEIILAWSCESDDDTVRARCAMQVCANGAGQCSASRRSITAWPPQQRRKPELHAGRRNAGNGWGSSRGVQIPVSSIPRRPGPKTPRKR